MSESRLPVIDRAALDAVRDIMEEGFQSLICAYLEEAQRLIERCASAAAAGDPDALRRAAHSLKSSSANVGAARLADVARQLEMSSHAGDASRTTSLLELATTAFQAVRERLERAKRA